MPYKEPGLPEPETIERDAIFQIVDAAKRFNSSPTWMDITEDTYYFAVAATVLGRELEYANIGDVYGAALAVSSCQVWRHTRAPDDEDTLALKIFILDWQHGLRTTHHIMTGDGDFAENSEVLARIYQEALEQISDGEWTNDAVDYADLHQSMGDLSLYIEGQELAGNLPPQLSPDEEAALEELDFITNLQSSEKD